MIRRTKEVITKIRDGAKTNKVKITKRLSEFTRSLGSLGADMDMSIFGTVTGSAPKAIRVKKNSITTVFLMAILRFWCCQEHSF